MFLLNALPKLLQFPLSYSPSTIVHRFLRHSSPGSWASAVAFLRVHRARNTALDPTESRSEPTFIMGQQHIPRSPLLMPDILPVAHNPVARTTRLTSLSSSCNCSPLLADDVSMAGNRAVGRLNSLCTVCCFRGQFHIITITWNNHHWFRRSRGGGRKCQRSYRFRWDGQGNCESFSIVLVLAGYANKPTYPLTN